MSWRFFRVQAEIIKVKVTAEIVRGAGSKGIGTVQIFGSRSNGASGDEPIPGRVLLQAPPGRAGVFTRSRLVEDFVILEWDTAYGTIGWAHYLRAPGIRALALSGAVYSHFWEHMSKIYTALALPAGGLNLDLAPRLEAVDLHSGARRSRVYEVTWSQLAGILGTNPPLWHWALRDADAMLEWKPGDPPAVIPADDPEVPARPLLELAADEPDGSPVSAACLWFAREARSRAGQSARDDIKEIGEEASKPGSDCAHIHVAAVPAPSLRPAETKPEETVLRAAWAQITERRDPLAWKVAQLAQRWDGGQAWPGGERAEFAPDSCQAAAEWTAGLKPAPGGQPPTVLERLLLEQVSDVDQAELLVDEASGFPAVRRTDHLGEVMILASVPQRISTTSPLAEVTFGGFTIWIRTEDGRLWLAPEVAGSGLSWGYRGGGPHALAKLLGKLLDDITAPPVTSRDRGQPDKGLMDLVQSAPQGGVTVYTRAQLLAARAG